MAAMQNLYIYEIHIFELRNKYLTKELQVVVEIEPK